MSEDIKGVSQIIRKTIQTAGIEDHELILSFTDGTFARLWDDAAHCCERRWMTSGDDMLSFSGAVIAGVEVADGGDVETKDNWNVHDMQFLRIHTSKGTLTCETHNEHNGYYGGFSLRCKVTE